MMMMMLIEIVKGKEWLVDIHMTGPVQVPASITLHLINLYKNHSWYSIIIIISVQ